MFFQVSLAVLGRRHLLVSTICALLAPPNRNRRDVVPAIGLNVFQGVGPYPVREFSEPNRNSYFSSTNNATAAESKTTSLNPKLPQPGGGISATNSTRRPWQRKLDTFVMNTSDLDKTVTPVRAMYSVVLTRKADRRDLCLSASMF